MDDRKILALLVTMCASCASPVPQVAHDSANDRFDLAPLETVDFAVTREVVSWRVAGNPRRSASPFADEVWFTLLDVEERGIEFLTGAELAADRFAEHSPAGAVTLRVDNASGNYISGSIVWTLEVIE